MLKPDDLLLYLREVMLRCFPEMETDRTISELSYDSAHKVSVVNSDKLQLDFDGYARCFQQSHGGENRVALPASCDGLSRFHKKSEQDEDRFCFVEYKNGDIVGYLATSQDRQTDQYFIKKKDAAQIERKLYDSAAMLTDDDLVTDTVIRRDFVALIVVRDDAIPASSQTPAAISPTANPTYRSLMHATQRFRLRSALGRAEARYSAVEVVTVDSFESNYLPELD